MLAARLLTCGHLVHCPSAQSGVRVVAFMFENLKVYQKAMDFADAVCGRTERFARGYAFLVDQLNRTALPTVAVNA